jgi:membrane protein
LVAALAFEIMKRSFALFIAKIPTYALVYGAFAVIPVFLLWIYFSWAVIVMGALIAALAPDFTVLRDSAGRASEAGFGDVLAILLALARAQQGPKVLELRKIAQHASLTVDQTEQLLERLVARGWVARSFRGRYAMAFDKERLLVADVYREFVLDGSAPAGKERSEPLNQLLEKFAARADETLNLPLGRLLERDTA